MSVIQSAFVSVWN